MTVDSERPSLVLSKLSAGTSYIVTVTTTQGRVQSDAHTSLITTGKDYGKLFVFVLGYKTLK